MPKEPTPYLGPTGINIFDIGSVIQATSHGQKAIIDRLNLDIRIWDSLFPDTRSRDLRHNPKQAIPQ